MPAPPSFILNSTSVLAPGATENDVGDAVNQPIPDGLDIWIETWIGCLSLFVTDTPVPFINLFPPFAFILPYIAGALASALVLILTIATSFTTSAPAACACACVPCTIACWFWTAPNWDCKPSMIEFN